MTPQTPINSAPLKLAVVLKGYPRLSETFIAQELLNLENSGFQLFIFSLRHPTDAKKHPVNDEITAQVNYLPEYLYQQPFRVIKSWFQVRRLPGYHAARKLFLKDLRRDHSTNRIRRFGQALVMAAEIAEQIPALYAHFLHTPASVARYAAMIRSLPWACSAHAKDIYTSPDWEINEKLEHCQWLTTCTRQNAAHLRAMTEHPGKIKLNYHGLDLQRFDLKQPAYTARNGSVRSDPVLLLSVGRAVEKKGYAGLLQALSAIDADLSWQLIHIGGGPLLGSMRTLSKQLGLDDRIQWLGAQSQQTVLQHYRQSDLFVLNSCIDQSGDRDGLPNVMVEAQSQGLAIVSTRLSGIPELVENQVNGLLVEPGDTSGLTLTLEKMIRQPGLRQQFGYAGREKVMNHFEMNASFHHLEPLLRQLTRSKAKAAPAALAAGESAAAQK